MSIEKLDLPPKVPLDAAQALRELADRIEKGELNSIVWAFADELYQLHYACSIKDGLILARLLEDYMVRQFYE